MKGKTIAVEIDRELLDKEVARVRALVDIGCNACGSDDDVKYVIYEGKVLCKRCREGWNNE